MNSRQQNNQALHAAFVEFLKRALEADEVPGSTLREVREFLKQEGCFAVAIDDDTARAQLAAGLRRAEARMAADADDADDEIVAEDGKVVKLRARA